MTADVLIDMRTSENIRDYLYDLKHGYRKDISLESFMNDSIACCMKKIQDIHFILDDISRDLPAASNDLYRVQFVEHFFIFEIPAILADMQDLYNVLYVTLDKQQEETLESINSFFLDLDFHLQQCMTLDSRLLVLSQQLQECWSTESDSDEQ